MSEEAIQKLLAEKIAKKKAAEKSNGSSSSSNKKPPEEAKINEKPKPNPVIVDPQAESVGGKVAKIVASTELGEQKQRNAELVLELQQKTTEITALEKKNTTLRETIKTMGTENKKLTQGLKDSGVHADQKKKVERLEKYVAELERILKDDHNLTNTDVKTIRKKHMGSTFTQAPTNLDTLYDSQRLESDFETGVLKSRHQLELSFKSDGVAVPLKMTTTQLRMIRVGNGNKLLAVQFGKPGSDEIRHYDSIPDELRVDTIAKSGELELKLIDINNPASPVLEETISYDIDNSAGERTFILSYDRKIVLRVNDISNDTFSLETIMIAS